MIKRVLIAISLLIVAAYSTAQILIQDSTFTESLNIYGHTWDSAIIKNCTFKNTILSDGIRIANADNVIIDSCIFYNIEGNEYRVSKIKKVYNSYHLTLKKDTIEYGGHYG